jgi:hypothetical protein
VANVSNMPLLGRTALIARIQQVATELPPSTRFPRLVAFLQFWKWILPYLRDCLHSNIPYRAYPVGKSGIFDIPSPADGSPLRIAVAGDWGTGTVEADTVAKNMKLSSPHVTIHLGDVYYMGESGEIDENCLGQRTKSYSGVYWPIESLGSFALMGNHEMYSGGHAYFDVFLKKLGVLNPDKTVKDPQSASYFCLETEHWLVLGLDTGYHSGGVPAFAAIPGLNKIPFFNIDARFDDKMLAWLKQTMNTLKAKGSFNKSILLLTHHQPFSSFDRAYTKPAEQLVELGFLDGREFVWLCGHEHRVTVYKQQTIANKLRAYPRCIGHGGMPVAITKLGRSEPSIAYYDPRQHPIDNEDPNTMVGYNGHVVLFFSGAELTIEYHDIVDDNLLLRETFIPTGTGGFQHSTFEPPNSPWLSV